MLIASDRELRDQFMHWQCMERLYAARQVAGYPVDAARPLVCYGADGSIGIELSVLILKQQLDELVAQYRFNSQKTADPIERLEWVVKQTSAEYYQKPNSFADAMTALCPQHQAYVEKLLSAKVCRMVFNGNGQSYLIPAQVAALPASDVRYQFTKFHNFHFNAKLPHPFVVLQFEPDWASAKVLDPTMTSKDAI